MKFLLKSLLLINMLMLPYYALADAASSAIKDEQENSDTTNKVERIVWPFTRWIEKKVQGSPLIRTPKVPPITEKTSKTLDLRGAIKQATTRYPGTVLNADKRTEEGAVTYQIRIISEKGVVKTIAVNGSNANDEIGSGEIDSGKIDSGETK